jgi:hypothetical protein
MEKIIIEIHGLDKKLAPEDRLCLSQITGRKKEAQRQITQPRPAKHSKP